MQIDKNIPIPGKRSGLASAVREMEVGDSILVKGRQDTTIRLIAKKLGWKFTSRVQPENKVRVWRVS